MTPSAEAHNSLAIIKMYYDWDYAGAEQEFKRATALNPDNALIHNWYGWYLGLMGRFDESFKKLERALEFDPLSDTINSALALSSIGRDNLIAQLNSFEKCST